MINPVIGVMGFPPHGFEHHGYFLQLRQSSQACCELRHRVVHLFCNLRCKQGDEALVSLGAMLFAGPTKDPQATCNSVRNHVVPAAMQNLANPLEQRTEQGSQGYPSSTAVGYL